MYPFGYVGIVIGVAVVLGWLTGITSSFRAILAITLYVVGALLIFICNYINDHK